MHQLFERLGNLDRRWFYLVMTVIILIPIFRPLGLPIAISTTTLQSWEVLQRSQPGDVILYGSLYSIGAAPDVDPGARAMLGYLLDKGCKIVIVSFVLQGDALAEEIVRGWEAEGYVYGEDFVNLGFVAGMESALAAVAADIYTITRDYRGNPVNPDVLPILRGISNAGDFDLTLSANTGNPGPEEWVRQIVEPYGVPYVTVHVTIGAPRVLPYVQSGQVDGLIIGLRGSAELEILAGRPGRGALAMDAQTFGHMAVLLFMFLGNLGQLAHYTRRGAKRKGDGA